MTEPTNDNKALIRVTLKGANHTAAPWVTFDGDEPDQIEATLQSAGNGNFYETVAESAVAFEKAYTTARPAAQAPTGGGTRPPLSDGQADPAGDAPAIVVLTKANFKNKDAVKALGARWDGDRKAWVVKPDYEPDYLTKFAAYL